MRVLNIALIAIILSSIFCEIKFGKHFGQGLSAVSYIYSSDGFWKQLKDLNYGFDKYSQGNSHILNPFFFDQMILKGQYLTCRDEEGHLLGDVSPLDGELDTNVRLGYAFHSHNGRAWDNVN